MTRSKNQIEFDLDFKFAEITTEKNIIVHDNYIYLIWILNVNYGFELWAKSPLIIKSPKSEKPKIKKPKGILVIWPKTQ
jgi:allophanate hydrolase subunit 1